MISPGRQELSRYLVQVWYVPSCSQQTEPIPQVSFLSRQAAYRSQLRYQEILWVGNVPLVLGLVLPLEECDLSVQAVQTYIISPPFISDCLVAAPLFLKHSCVLLEP